MRLQYSWSVSYLRILNAIETGPHFIKRTSRRFVHHRLTESSTQQWKGILPRLGRYVTEL